jgi:hypothetical protein
VRARRAVGLERETEREPHRREEHEPEQGRGRPGASAKPGSAGHRSTSAEGG